MVYRVVTADGSRETVDRVAAEQWVRRVEAGGHRVRARPVFGKDDQVVAVEYVIEP